MQAHVLDPDYTSSGRARALDRRGKERGVGAVGKMLQPAGRIDDVHARSSSRGRSVSTPLRNRRIFFIGRCGISSMRFSYTMACTFYPGGELERLADVLGNDDLKLGQNRDGFHRLPLNKRIV